MAKAARSAGILTLCAATALPVWAQDSGGVLLTFGISQNVSVIENQSFAPASPGSTLRTTTDLSAALSSQTQSSQFSLSAVTALTGVDSPGGDGFDLTAGEPRFTLRYATQAADSSLSATLSYTERDITFIDPLTDFLDEDGNIIFSDDFIDLSGTGTRQSLSYGASLSIRDDRPFGLTFSASVLDLNYVDATTPALQDSTRTNLGVSARLDINEVTRADIGLSRERVETGGSSFDTTSLTGDLSIERPNGAIGFGLSATETNAGTRLGLSFSRAYQLPGDVSLSASLGVTRPAASDDLFFTTAFSYARPLPNGQFNARLNRSFGTGSDGGEQVQTSLAVNATHALTPLATLDLDAAYAQTEETATEASASLTSIGATLSYQLTRDWDFSAGVTLESRDTSDTARAERSTISVTLARDFSFRP